MESTVTIKMRSVVMTVAIMIAVLAAYLIGSSGPGSGASAADDSATSDTNKIVMTGTSDVTGVPDELSFNVGVKNTSSDVSTALGNASNTMHRVLAALTKAGVDRKDVRTSGLSVRPNYSYVNGSRVLVGYQAAENLSVLVRSLPDAGGAIRAAVDAGGNAVVVDNVQLKIGDMDSLLDKARADAVADAKAKAQQYADAAGSSLGAVISVHEVGGGHPQTVQFARAAAYDSALDSIPIRPGRSTLKVTVSITWSLG